MQIQISSKNMDLATGIGVYIEEKIGPLDKHLQKFEMEGELNVKVHVSRTTEHHHKGEIYEASADLALPGAHLHAENVNEDIRTAIDIVRDVLVQEIEKYKAKHS